MEHLARLPKHIGVFLAWTRKERGMTQADLAAKVGLRQEAISRIECGNGATRLSTMLDIIAALDLDLIIGPRRKGSPQDMEDFF